MRRNKTNEELIVRYLLGELSESEQSEFEEQYFANDDLYYEIRVVEQGLIGRYVQGSLPKGRRERFESHFMPLVEGQRKVDLGRAFYNYLEEARETTSGRQVDSWRQIVFERLHLRRPRISYALAAMLALVIGCSWLAFETRRLQRQISQIAAKQVTEKQAYEAQLANERRQREYMSKELGQMKMEVAQAKSDKRTVKAGGILRPNGSANWQVKQPSEKPHFIESDVITASTPIKTFDVISPSGTLVRENQPILRWDRYGEATGYQAFFSGDDTPVSEVILNVESKLARTLRRGEVYTWYVVAFKDGRRIAESRKATFKVASQATVDEIERVNRKYPDSGLSRGIAYLQAGLLDDFDREFQKRIGSKSEVDVRTQCARQ